MPRIGVTGHMDLTPPSVPIVQQALKETLALYVPAGLTGVSCIAAGADSIFADVVLDLGGDLEVILPATDYRECKVKPDHADLFDNLISRASNVRVMPHDVSNRAAYESANEALVGSVDLLVAVWDGRAAADRGGTAAVVEDARSKGVDVTIVWPDGVERRRHIPS